MKINKVDKEKCHDVSETIDLTDDEFYDTNNAKNTFTICMSKSDWTIQNIVWGNNGFISSCENSDNDVEEKELEKKRQVTLIWSFN